MKFEYLLAIIISSVIALIIILGTICFVLIRKRKNKEPKEFPELLEALGGIKNIIEVTQKGSRVSVILDNKKIIDKAKLKDNGVDTVVVSNKKLTMVVGNVLSVSIHEYLNQQINL